MYGARIHDVEFVRQMQETLSSTTTEDFATKARLESMLGMAGSELDQPFYITPNSLSAVLHCVAIPTNLFASALLNAGYKVGHSHALRGSLKTNAPSSFIWDIMRKWIERNPVREERLKSGTAVKAILEKPAGSEIIFDIHPASEALAAKGKTTRWQENPMPDWGPKSRAKG